MTSEKLQSKKKAFFPKKGLGQRFLIRGSVANKMISRSGFGPSDTVLEIGPGFGALTIPLARTVRRVVAVEKDEKVMEMLGEKLERAGISNVKLLHGDILKTDFDSLYDSIDEKLNIIGNLPYNISSPVLKKLMANRGKISRAVLMFQKEFAERLIASPGKKTYGAITVLLRYNAEASALFRVPKEAFRPKPKVESMVICIDFQRPYSHRPVKEESLKRVVKAAFSRRRKTLLNALSSVKDLGDKATVLKALQECGIDPTRRAETLHMEDFLCLTLALI